MQTISDILGDDAQRFHAAAEPELLELARQFRFIKRVATLPARDREALSDLLAAAKKMEAALGRMSWEAQDLVADCLPVPSTPSTLASWCDREAVFAAREILQYPQALGAAVEAALRVHGADTAAHERQHGQPMGRGRSALDAAKRELDAQVVAVIAKHYQGTPTRTSSGPFVRLVKAIYPTVAGKGARIDPRPHIPKVR